MLKRCKSDEADGAGSAEMQTRQMQRANSTEDLKRGNGNAGKAGRRRKSLDPTKSRLRPHGLMGGPPLARSNSHHSASSKETTSQRSRNDTKSPSTTNSPQERSFGNSTPPLDPSVGFLSDPSASEEEVTEIGSSRMDHRKKLLYRQRLREFDALSVGDTSLSSSNMSPTPQRFRIQFDGGSDRSVGRVRDRVKAASARLSIGSNVLPSESRTSPSSSSGNRMDGNMNMLEAALLPPSLSGDAQSASDGNAHNNGPLHNNLQQRQAPSGVPPLPNLEGRRNERIEGGDDSASSADSVRGIGITTERASEQRSGESSSSAFQGAQNEGSGNGSTPRTISQPESEMAKRARRRSPHKRVRSGDGVAAALANMGREDWRGMNRHGLPLPIGRPHAEEDDGSSGLLGRRENHSSWSNESPPPLFAYGSLQSGRTWDGYSADVGSMGGATRDSGSGPLEAPLRRRSSNGSGRNNRATPSYGRTNSADTFDFSESAVSGGSVGRAGLSNSDPNSRPWDGARRFVPESLPSWDRGDGMAPRSGHMRYATHASGTPAMHVADQPHLQWLNSYQAEMRKNFVPNDYRDSDESDYSSGSSRTSSSYTDNSVKMRERGVHARHHSRHVKFASSLTGEPTKFDKLMRRVDSVLDKPIYRKAAEEAEAVPQEMPVFYCPNCKTEQRDFINFATATGSYEPQGYLAVYFAIYLVSSLFVFGLEEGWAPLDCVYFSVITLTTTGLGDFVPASDVGKILCACFIYIGVATIGLLLGTLIAGSMDTARIKEASEAQIRDCPNCLRLEKQRRRSAASGNFHSFNMGDGYDELKENLSYTSGDASSNNLEDGGNVGLDLFETAEDPQKKATDASAVPKPQIHTRHMSMDIGGKLFGNAKPAPLRRTGSSDGLPTTIDEDTPLLGTTPKRATSTGDVGIMPMEIKSLDDSYSSSSSSADSFFANPSKPMSRVKAAKYTILTLNKALMNSSFIIAAGSIGFYFIEGLTAVDSFYFTTVLLTSVGYGDIVPVTTPGKIFATIFVVVAGTVLLHNMTMIASIPLELRKRRIEHAVLGQFGDQLTDDELRELSTGRLINRLKLATNRPDGLEECTREMFSLAMLVRLGRISEEDVKATFAAFRRLDVGNYGKLNSRTIIEGELMRRKSIKNLAAMAAPETEFPPPRTYPMSPRPAYPQETYYPGSPNPFMNPMGVRGASSGSLPLRRHGSVDSYYSQGIDSRASSFDGFDHDAYEQWASHFTHYSPRIRKRGAFA
ncbi:hypothetical protein ACHAXT_008938 [Thalassiosira profunda]